MTQKVAAVSSLKNSTIVRSLWQAPIRAGAEVASKLAPGLLHLSLEKVFTSTRRFPASDEEKRVLALASPFQVPFEGRMLQAYSWGDGPTVLLVHGWHGRASQFHAFVEPLLQAGYSVVAFDGPGHGASPGKSTNLLEFARAVWAVAARSGGVEAVIAHSFGAGATTLALKLGMQLKQAIFLAPPENQEFFFDRFTEYFGISEGVRDAAKRSMEERHGFKWSDIQVTHLARHFRVPLTVFHDIEDREVPWTHASALVQAWPDAKLVSLQKIGHYRILRAPDVVSGALKVLQATDAAAVKAE